MKKKMQTRFCWTIRGFQNAKKNYRVSWKIRYKNLKGKLIVPKFDESLKKKKKIARKFD